MAVWMARMQFSVVAAHQSSQWEGKNTYRGAESTRRPARGGKRVGAEKGNHMTGMREN